ncbi:MAG: hypothetical protein LBB81_06385 [Treponema sp.]|nr:hypothetical protein [Treponema sp.]
METKIVQNLTPNFDSWLLTTFGCSVHINLGYPEGQFTTFLHNSFLNIEVAIILQKIGFDTPCRTVGDIEKGKLRSIPHSAILKFQKEHREEILAWLNTKERRNFLKNPESIKDKLIAAGHRGCAA